ncbi:MAG: anthranilate phosphoribosyltransferase [Cyclobacteriaceae bacterium]|jgi:anthranilate phosphoribosyltransferase
MKDILNSLFEGQTLTHQEAKAALTEIGLGQHNISTISCFLTVFMMRSITAEELGGFRDAMLDLCVPVNLEGYDAMDMCGTGGDGKDTFNISTLASFVVAGAGQKVAKHGNNGVSSSCGSSNLLNHFGYEFTNDVIRLQSEIEQAGICFLHAPLFHPAMKHVGPVRKELGLKTFFNMLGPLVNPSRPKKQLAGVYNAEVQSLYQAVFKEEGMEFAVVHAVDGYDEISLTGDFLVATETGINLYNPEELGLEKLAPESLHAGGTIEESAEIFMNVLKGEATKAQISVTLANAGLGLFSVKKAQSFKEGIDMAEESLASGRALEAFNMFLKIGKS